MLSILCLFFNFYPPFLWRRPQLLDFWGANGRSWAVKPCATHFHDIRCRPSETGADVDQKAACSATAREAEKWNEEKWSYCSNDFNLKRNKRKKLELQENLEKCPYYRSKIGTLFVMFCHLSLISQPFIGPIMWRVICAVWKGVFCHS